MRDIQISLKKLIVGLKNDIKAEKLNYYFRHPGKEKEVERMAQNGASRIRLHFSTEECLVWPRLAKRVCRIFE